MKLLNMQFFLNSWSVNPLFCLYLSQSKPLTTLQIQTNWLHDIKSNSSSYLGYVKAEMIYHKHSCCMRKYSFTQLLQYLTSTTYIWYNCFTLLLLSGIWYLLQKISSSPCYTFWSTISWVLPKENNEPSVGYSGHQICYVGFIYKQIKTHTISPWLRRIWCYWLTCFMVELGPINLELIKLSTRIFFWLGSKIIPDNLCFIRLAMICSSSIKCCSIGNYWYWDIWDTTKVIYHF